MGPGSKPGAPTPHSLTIQLGQPRYGFGEYVCLSPVLACFVHLVGDDFVVHGLPDQVLLVRALHDLAGAALDGLSTPTQSVEAGHPQHTDRCVEAGTEHVKEHPKKSKCWT